MLTKGKIQSLRAIATDKKERAKKSLFIVEGEKSIHELLKTDLIVEEIYFTHEFQKKYKDMVHAYFKRLAFKQIYIKPNLIEAGELNLISNFETSKNPVGALALVKQFEIDSSEENIIKICKNEKTIILNDIRDPGNLGTIIRIADWYGIDTIIASNESVDVYNHKTIAASMGSYSRVKVVYTDVFKLIPKLKKEKVEMIASTLKGQNANTFKWPKNAALVIGNESNGVDRLLLVDIKNQITLPSQGGAESLNAAVATGILLDRWINS